MIHHEPRLAERLEIEALDHVGLRLFNAQFGKAAIASRELIFNLLQTASERRTGHPFTLPFIVSEWYQVVDAWQVSTWEAYRDIKRLGRKTRLREKPRAMLWAVFKDVLDRLAAQQKITPAAVFSRLAKAMQAGGPRPFDFVVVDESQDLSVPQLRFLAALDTGQPNGLFFAGDLGQRIFQQPFSWKSLGVDIRGRAKTLRTNYRTSHQIRRQADRLLNGQIADMDGNTEPRNATVSVFNGPLPQIAISADAEQERQTAATDADLEEIYATERHLLYVACTRARDNLLVSGVAPGSEFLEDMGGDRHYCS